MEEHSNSTRTVLITILIIVLLGALGFVIWQNSQKQNQQISNSPTVNEPTSNEPEKPVEKNGSISGEAVYPSKS